MCIRSYVPVRRSLTYNKENYKIFGLLPSGNFKKKYIFVLKSRLF